MQNVVFFVVSETYPKLGRCAQQARQFHVIGNTLPQFLPPGTGHNLNPVLVPRFQYPIPVVERHAPAVVQDPETEGELQMPRRKRGREERLCQARRETLLLETFHDRGGGCRFVLAHKTLRDEVWIGGHCVSCRQYY